MKLVLIVLGVVAVLALSGFGMSFPSMDSFHVQSMDGWAEKLQAAFDPSWYEKFQKADLPTMLQAVTGSARK